MMPVAGPGALFIQRSDIPLQTPINVGRCNELSLDSSFTQKPLYGQGEDPLFIGRFTRKWTAKVKSALVSGIALNSAFYGQTFAAGQQVTALSESHQVTAGAATVTNSAHFVSDLGVVYAATGLPLTLVSATPSVGQYTVSAGVYGFNVGDNNAGIFITYTWNNTSSGQQLAINSQLIGTDNPTFQAWYYSQTNGVPLNVQLFQCTCDKLNMAFKLEDFMYPELDFSLAQNAAGKTALLSFGEVS